MCIVLLTTAHPRYALILIDNRDEFILRPTSRPHWWRTPITTAGPGALKPPPNTSNNTPARTVTPALSSGTSTPLPQPRTSVPPPPPATSSAPPGSVTTILSSRDLQRAERGTWLGITSTGNFAVLTNYRETDTHDSEHPVHGVRSRGGMVTAWLSAHPSVPLGEFVEDMVSNGGVKGVGGFSLMCGKLRRKKNTEDGEEKDGKGKGEENHMAPLAIISNRYSSPDEIPWLASARGETIGLSNTCYGDPDRWPKLEVGKTMLDATIKSAVAEGLDEDALVEKLFAILDRDTLTKRNGMSFEDYIVELKNSIFVPAIGDEGHGREMEEARKGASTGGDDAVAGNSAYFHPAPEELREDERPEAGGTEKDSGMGFMTGMYGTQRQTVVLVDWEGNVRFTERALWDAHGREVERGMGDETFRFGIEGWDSERWGCDGEY